MLTFPRVFIVLLTIVVRAIRVLARSRAGLVLETRGRSQRATPPLGGAPEGRAQERPSTSPFDSRSLR